MSYEDQLPSACPPVCVEWRDITGQTSEAGLARRWTWGCLLSTTHVSEGVDCTVIGATWDDDGWSDISTFPNSDIISLEEL